MARREDLEGHIRESYGLIREYEELSRLSADPREKARARRAVEEQWGLIEEYLEEYLSLCHTLGTVIPPDVQEIAAACRARQAGSAPVDKMLPSPMTRGVQIGGDVEESVIVTGDGNVITFGMQLSDSPSAPSSSPTAGATTAPSQALAPALLRLRDAAGRVVGAAFLVEAHRALTCNHVVEAVGEDVQVDLPLLAPGRLLCAHVIHRDAEADVAVLEPVDELPAGAAPVLLMQAGDLWGHPFRAFGFPEGHPEGVWASGTIRAANARGWLQIEHPATTGYRVQPGFSGSPVWDEVLGGVVGMIVAAERDPQVRAAFIIPANHLPYTP